MQRGTDPMRPSAPQILCLWPKAHHRRVYWKIVRVRIPGRLPGNRLFCKWLQKQDHINGNISRYVNKDDKFQEVLTLDEDYRQLMTGERRISSRREKCHYWLSKSCDQPRNLIHTNKNGLRSLYVYTNMCAFTHTSNNINKKEAVFWKWRQMW